MGNQVTKYDSLKVIHLISAKSEEDNIIAYAQGHITTSITNFSIGRLTAAIKQQYHGSFALLNNLEKMTPLSSASFSGKNNNRNGGFGSTSQSCMSLPLSPKLLR